MESSSLRPSDGGVAIVRTPQGALVILSLLCLAVLGCAGAPNAALEIISALGFGLVLGLAMILSARWAREVRLRRFSTPARAGYCYLALFEPARWAAMAQRFGANPWAAHLLHVKDGWATDRRFCTTGIGTYRHVEEVSESVGGMEPRKVLEAAPNVRVGEQLDVVSIAAVRFQDPWRFILMCHVVGTAATLLVVVTLCSIQVMLAIIGLVLLTVARALPHRIWWLTGLAVLWSYFNWQQVAIIVCAFSLCRLAYHQLVPTLFWREPVAPLAKPLSGARIPPGRGQLPRTPYFYRYTIVAGPVGHKGFVRYCDTSKFVTDIIAQLYPATINHEVVHLGNPHKDARAMTQALIDHFAVKLTGMIWVVIGGSFDNLPNPICGVALQPVISNNDQERLNRARRNATRNQIVLEAAIDPDCGLVGDDDCYEPNITLEGVEGGIAWMTHVYDIPLRAVLAHCSHWGVRELYVIMHCSPEVFLSSSGWVPISKQRFRHNPDGTTEFEWAGTSGATFTHNTAVYLEYFTTDYVEVRPGEWWVGVLTRSCGDVYAFRWSKQRSKPLPIATTQLVVSVDDLSCRCPALAYHRAGAWVYWIELSKAIAESLQRAQSQKAWREAARALGSSQRQGVMDFGASRVLTQREVDQLWEAELYRRKLAAEEEGPTRWQWWFDLFPFTLPSEERKFAAKVALAQFMRQIPETVKVPLRRHDQAYVAVETIGTVTSMVYPFTHCDLAGPMMQMIRQTGMDRTCPVLEVTVMVTDDTPANPLSRALYGTRDALPQLIPVGDPFKGGSKFVPGPGVLPCEVEYALTTMDVVLYLHLDDGYVRVGGVATDKRAIVVVLDRRTGEPPTTYRVLYPKRFGLEELDRHFSARFGDWAQYSESLGLRQPGRSYIENPQTAQIVPRAIPNRYGGPVAPRQMPADPVPRIHSVLPQVNGVDRYDVLEGLTNNLLPPHLWAMGTVVDMRNFARVWDTRVHYWAVHSNPYGAVPKGENPNLAPPIQREAPVEWPASILGAGQAPNPQRVVKED